MTLTRMPGKIGCAKNRSHATEEGLLKKNDFRKHPIRDEAREAAKTGSSNCARRSEKSKGEG